MFKIVLLHKIAMTRSQEIDIGTSHLRGAQEGDRAGSWIKESFYLLGISGIFRCNCSTNVLWTETNPEDLGKEVEIPKWEKFGLKGKKGCRGLKTF